MGATSIGDDLPLTPESLELQRGWEAAAWAGMSQPDGIADVVNGAQCSLEAILTPHLRADAALLPVAISWRAGKAWLEARVKPDRRQP
jgi:hypothetical protein